MESIFFHGMILEITDLIFLLPGMEVSMIYWMSPDKEDNGSNILWPGMEASLIYWMSLIKEITNLIFLWPGMEASIIYWMSPDTGDN
jgi:hypothetical protein